MNAVNAVKTVITEYGENPTNPSRGLIRETMARLHGWLVPAVTGADGSDERTFHGYAQTQQDFKGAANPASTGVTYRGTAEFTGSGGGGPTIDSARRIFADRLARGRSL